MTRTGRRTRKGLVRASVLSRLESSFSFNSALGSHTQPYIDRTTHNSTQTSLVLQQIWPAVPKLIGYDVAVQHRDATRLAFFSAFPVLSWLRDIALGSGEGVILPRGIPDIEKERERVGGETYRR